MKNKTALKHKTNTSSRHWKTHSKPLQMKAEAFFVRVSMSYGREYSKKQNLKKPTTQASKPIPKKKKKRNGRSRRSLRTLDTWNEHLQNSTPGHLQQGMYLPIRIVVEVMVNKSVGTVKNISGSEGHGVKHHQWWWCHNFCRIFLINSDFEQETCKMVCRKLYGPKNKGKRSNTDSLSLSW